jgi:hypothetical protein
MVVEGPGELDLLDDLTAVLHNGRVVVRMPKGTHGFRVRTASADVLDLGMEFAVGVGNGNVTDAQVYDGAVMASSGLRPEATIEYRSERFVRELPADVGIAWTGKPEPNSASETWQYGRPQHDSINGPAGRGKGPEAGSRPSGRR